MMRILFSGNKERGISCLRAVRAKHRVVGVIGHKKTNKTNHFVDEAKKMGFEVFQPIDINDQSFITKIKVLAPDVIILAGYGPIVNKNFISIAKYGCINLHGGKLPKYRGSSPMNWALINGEKNFTITIIQVNEGVDTGNVLIKRAVFEKCGLFDEQFEKMRMGDGEFGVRAYLNGFKAISNPNANRIHFKHFDGGLRELGTWDAFRSTNIFQPKPVPSVLYYWRKYWGNEAALISSIIILPTSFTPYREKGKKSGKLLSIIFFLVFLPFVYILYFLAWKKSSNMLKTGHKIDKL